MNRPDSLAWPPRMAAALAALALAPLAAAVEQTFTYYRWTPTGLRDNVPSNSVQLSEFRFYRAGTAASWTGAGVTNPGGNNPAGEPPAMLIDGLTTTKWLDFNKQGLVFAFPAATTIDSYRFATANDAIERDPVSWTLEGSDDQSNWTLIDVVRNHPTTTDRFAYQSFALPASLLPEILAFEPSGDVVLDGTDHYLIWNLDRTDTAAIDQGVGPVDPVAGSTSIDPPDDADTTYTLTATSGGGTSTAAVRIRSVTGGTVTARYVRFTPLQLRSGTMIQLAEFAFLGAGTPVVPATVTNPGGSNAPDAAEGALMAIDGDWNTKWLDANMMPLVFDFGTAAEFDHYLLTTANDFIERDPLRWTMEASDDGVTWALIENMTAFDFNMPTSRYADSQPIPLPGPSLQPLLSASADFASILIGESVDLSWSSTGAATLTCEPGLGALDADGSLAVSPTADTTYTFTATAAGGRTATATVFIHVADPTVDTIAYDDFDIAGDEINLLGSAALVNAHATLPQGGDVRRLRLTPDVGSSTGAAWFRHMQDLGGGFETTFAFQFTTAQSGDGADGMALVIHNDPRRAEAMPGSFHEFGLAANALNICLDSYLNTGEASAARLLVRSGATTLATVNLAAVPGLTLFSTNQGADLTDTAGTGSPFVVHATCTPGDLDISINGLEVVSNLNVDLAAIGALDASNRAFVGFTARTGGSFECHDVTSWHFTPLEAGYAAWVGGFGGLPDAAPGADPDGDGLTNLLEYVLDGHPAESSTGILPKGPVDAGGNLLFTYVRRAESKADTTQVLELSTDLVTWAGSDVPGATAGNAEVVGNWPAAGLETVTVTVPPSAAADGRLFARLRVGQR